MDAEMKAWQAKRDLEILSAAQQIQGDPARIAAVRAEVERQKNLVNDLGGNKGVTMKQVGGSLIPQFNRKDV